MNSPSDQLENPDQAANPDVTPPDACLDSLPNPQLKNGLHRVIQLVNCSNATLLGTANAAQTKGFAPLPVLPREGTWIMQPFNPQAPANGLNVLTIDIPLQWENTVCPKNAHGMCQGIVGPRMWARTGCRYDLSFDKAQCETGGCSGAYDCSAALQSASVGTTVAEWTFNQPVSSQTLPPNNWCMGDGQPPSGAGVVADCKDFPDISAVDGVNLNMDIQPLGGAPHDPFDALGGHDIQWLAEQYPLTVHGQDMRAGANCNLGGFQLLRSFLATGKPYGFVILDSSGKPLNGDSTVACFSNCGRYAFPKPPPEHCAEDANNPDGTLCYRWKAFCLGDPSKYGKPCMTDKDCPVAGACWNNPGSALNNTCQGRAFIKNSMCLNNPQTTCPYLTYPYGYVDPVNGTIFKSTQPPFGLCADVKPPHANPDSIEPACIGDDTLHMVMPKAYTWPNDPQVYGGDAPAYRVIFAPGGNSVPITPTSTIPFCKDLAAESNKYDLTSNLRDCKGPIDYGALFAVANPFGKSWACDLDPTGAGDEGVICRWNSDTVNPVSKINQVGLKGNFNSAGSNLQLNAIPGVQANDLLLASITFNSPAGTPSLPSGWSPVPNADVTSKINQRTAVWYHFVTNQEPGSYTWTWNAKAYPAGGLTAWRGVSMGTPFDVPAVTAFATKPEDKATAPPITTMTADTRVLSVYGAGKAQKPAFALPFSEAVSGKPVGDETGAVKVNGGDNTGTYYGHLVGDRIQSSKGEVLAQSVRITQTASEKPPIPVTDGANWTAITMVLRSQ